MSGSSTPLRPGETLVKISVSIEMIVHHKMINNLLYEGTFNSISVLFTIKRQRQSTIFELKSKSLKSKIAS